MPAVAQPARTSARGEKRKRVMSVMPQPTNSGEALAQDEERKAISVDKNVSVPPGMMLKRNVRVVRQKGEHTAEQKREMALLQSKHDCWRLYQQVDFSLPPLERLQQLVQKLLESEHMRAQAGEAVTDADYARVSGQMMASLRDEEMLALFEPKPRPNPENVALEKQVRSLELVRECYKEELAKWGRIDKELTRMEKEKRPPIPPVQLPETAEHIALAAALKKSIEGVEQYVMQAERLKDMVRKMQRKAAEDEVKEERIMAAVVRKVGKQLGELKTPEKPEAFPDQL